MRLVLGITLAAAAGCAFSLPGASGDDAPATDAGPGGNGGNGGDGGDAGDGIGDVAHVSSAVEDMFGATSLVTIGSAVLDTGVGAQPPDLSGVTLPADAALISAPQDGGGPDLAILMVGELAVTGTLEIRGQRPLVIIARGSITIDGEIDGSARAGIGGPGSRTTGAGRGGNGQAGGNFADTGGGGGGFGGAGSAGQAADVAGGGAGAAYGTAQLDVLEGGTSGGTTSPLCNGRSSGGGGGAIQLHARGTITIAGAIRTNGGGGSGGVVCPQGNLATSGAGGGSGGAIYLQATTITGGGMLLAQGGGGGGGSNYNSGATGGDGAAGSTAIAAAIGGTGTGTGVGVEDNRGAAGAYRDGPATVLTAISGQNYGNGGGGGGGVGRIVVRSSSAAGVETSPQAVVVAP